MSEKGLPSLLDRHWAESALAVGAVIIAAVSLWMAYDTNRTNHELVASASWPYVSVYESDTLNEPRLVRLYLSNDGIGPAKVEAFELFWKGKPERNPWELLLDCCSQTGGTDAGRASALAALLHDPDLGTSSDAGMVMRAGEALPFIYFTRSAANAPTWDAFHSNILGNLSFRYCYCSAFDECWLISHRLGSTSEMNPPRVRYCPRPKVGFNNRLD